MITYEGLKSLCRKHSSLRKVSNELGINNETVDRIRFDKPINMSTLDKYCSFFHCQPSELIEWKPLNEQEEIQAIEAEIEKLQERLRYLENKQ